MCFISLHRLCCQDKPFLPAHAGTTVQNAPCRDFIPLRCSQTLVLRQQTLIHTSSRDATFIEDIVGVIQTRSDQIRT